MPTHLTSSDFGTASGKVCQGNDARLTDSRSPSTHASSHASGAADPVTLAQSQVTNLTSDLAAKQATSAKDQASGYAGLNSGSRVTKGMITADDVIVDSTTKGVVLKASGGHYFRLVVSDLGVVTTSDLGTSAP